MRHLLRFQSKVCISVFQNVLELVCKKAKPDTVFKLSMYNSKEISDNVQQKYQQYSLVLPSGAPPPLDALPAGFQVIQCREMSLKLLRLQLSVDQQIILIEDLQAAVENVIHFLSFLHLYTYVQQHGRRRGCHPPPSTPWPTCLHKERKSWEVYAGGSIKRKEMFCC